METGSLARRPLKDLRQAAACDFILVCRARKGCGWQMFSGNRINKAASGLEVRDEGVYSQRPWSSSAFIKMEKLRC